MDCQCNRCHATVQGVPPSKRARRLIVLFGIALFVLAPLAGGIVGLSLIAVPGIIAMGLAIGPLAQLFIPRFTVPAQDGAPAPLSAH